MIIITKESEGKNRIKKTQDIPLFFCRAKMSSRYTKENENRKKFRDIEKKNSTNPYGKKPWSLAGWLEISIEHESNSLQHPMTNMLGCFEISFKDKTFSHGILSLLCDITWSLE